MKKRLIARSTVIGLLAVITLLIVLNQARAILPDASELDLNQNGFVQEINWGSEGHLWISDYSAKEVWDYNPATQVYTTYGDMASPRDARTGPDGSLWWAASDEYGLGHLVLDQSSATIWKLSDQQPPLPPPGQNLGVAFNQVGKVWTTDALNPVIFSFDPDSMMLCKFVYGTDGGSDYIIADANVIWLGDSFGERLLRIDPGGPSADIWELASGAFPVGISLDDQDNLWYADKGLLNITRLEIGSNRFTSYSVPEPPSQPNYDTGQLSMALQTDQRSHWSGRLVLDRDGPTAVAWHENRVWYTYEGGGHFGRLAPAVAESVSTIITPSHVSLATECRQLGESDKETVTISMDTQTAQWTGASYTPTFSTTGFTLFELPPQFDGQSGSVKIGQPWGIAIAGENVWVTVQVQQKLSWLSYTDCYHLVGRHSGLGNDPIASPDRSEGCGPGQYLPGETISMSAEPATNWTVDSWNGTIDDSSESSENIVEMPALDILVTVNYVTDIELYLPAVIK